FVPAHRLATALAQKVRLSVAGEPRKVVLERLCDQYRIPLCWQCEDHPALHEPLTLDLAETPLGEILERLAPRGRVVHLQDDLLLVTARNGLGCVAGERTAVVSLRHLEDPVRVETSERVIHELKEMIGPQQWTKLGAGTLVPAPGGIACQDCPEFR